MQRIDQEFLDSLERKHVLALDIAEHTGYHSIYDSGVAYFPKTETAAKKYGSSLAVSIDAKGDVVATRGWVDGSSYQQHKAFGDWLEKIIVDNGFRVVAVEDVNVGKNFIALRKLSELRGVLYYVCAKLDIPIVFFNVSDIKRFATGDGNANKEKMMEYCRKRWHIEPIDDNNADAIHIYYHFIKRYKL